MAPLSTAEKYELSPLFRAERSPLKDTALQVTGGSGSDRQVLEFDEPALLLWLLSRTAPESRPGLCASLRLTLGIADDETAPLVDYVIENEILVSETTARRCRAKGDVWEHWGWRDAYDFHAATSGLRFEKLWGSETAHQLFEEYMADERFGPQPPIFKEFPGGRGVPLGDGFSSAEDSSSGEGESGEGATIGGWAALSDALLANGPVPTAVRPHPVSREDVAQVLRAAFATQRTFDVAVLGPHQQKAFPSGGARHPLELFVAVRTVEGLAPGTYAYDSFLHELIPLAGPEALGRIEAAMPEHPGARTAPVLLFLTVRWVRHLWKYRYARSYRMVLMEAGHAAQSLRLAGAGRGLTAWCTPLVAESEICRVLGMDDAWQESPLCVLGLATGVAE